MKRYGSVLKIKPERLEEYTRYHAAVWPEILRQLKESHVQNYSIFHRDGYLFSYLEYTGDDFAADMGKWADDPVQIEWQRIMKGMQMPVQSHAEGEWWAGMEEVFHMD